jgi:biotin-(acetyl-CoA carboxylase) ligase
VKPSQSHNAYSHRISNEVKEAIQAASLPFDLHVAEEVASTMGIVTWARNHLIEPAAGLTLVAKNQTAGQGQSGVWLSNQADLKVTLLLPSPPLEALSLIRAGFAWATAEAIRIAASQKQMNHPFEIGIKLPNDVRILQESKTLKIAGVLALFPGQISEHRLMCEKFSWECPANMMLLGIGVGLTRPQQDAHVKTHLGQKKLSEIATTLDQWTAQPAQWNDLLVPLLHKISLVHSLVGEGNLDTLAKMVAKRFALGKDNKVLLEERGEAPRVVTVLGASRDGVSIEFEGRRDCVAFDKIERFTPYGFDGV